MKMEMKSPTLFFWKRAILLLFVGWMFGTIAQAQTTTYTYQGNERV